MAAPMEREEPVMSATLPKSGRTEDMMLTRVVLGYDVGEVVVEADSTKCGEEVLMLLYPLDARTAQNISVRAGIYEY